MSPPEHARSRRGPAPHSAPARRRLPLLLLPAFLTVAAAGGVVARGPWSGAMTDTSATVVARLHLPAAQTWLELSESPDFDSPRRIEPQPERPGDLPEIARFELTALHPATRYHYRFRRAGADPGEDDRRDRGGFRTFPRAGDPASFKFAFSACADTGSTHPVFLQILRQEPAVFLHLGDLHYENITWDRRESFRLAYDSVLGSRTQRELYRAVPIVYTWDDHDFGPNGADRHSPSRDAAHATYREYVPHHPLAAPGPDGPIAQAFTLGRARFLVLDARSARDAATAPDDAAKTLLGAWQKDWLQRELLAARDRFPLIFIVSSVSWVSNEHGSRDNWGRYTTERAELSDWMVAQGIRGVCFVSGDAHMLAADDGRHNDYARGGGPNFPALQAAPLDRYGSIKGGPWSVAPQLPAANEGQFGLVEVDDRGDTLHVVFRGLDQDGREKLRLEFTVPGR